MRRQRWASIASTDAQRPSRALTVAAVVDDRFDVVLGGQVDDPVTEIGGAAAPGA